MELDESNLFGTPDEKRACRRYHQISRTTLKEIRAANDQELERRFDELLTVGRPFNCPQIMDWQLGPDDYRDELNRRAADRETQSIKLLSILATVAAVLAALPILRDIVQWLMTLAQ